MSGDVAVVRDSKKVHPKDRNHGEGPSRGLLPDYEPSDGPSFESLTTATSLLTTQLTAR